MKNGERNKPQGNLRQKISKNNAHNRNYYKEASKEGIEEIKKRYN